MFFLKHFHKQTQSQSSNISSYCLIFIAFYVSAKFNFKCFKFGHIQLPFFGVSEPCLKCKNLSQMHTEQISPISYNLKRYCLGFCAPSYVLLTATKEEVCTGWDLLSISEDANSELFHTGCHSYNLNEVPIMIIIFETSALFSDLIEINQLVWLVDVSRRWNWQENSMITVALWDTRLQTDLASNWSSIFVPASTRGKLQIPNTDI